MKSYYEYLGVKPDATKEQIRAAYKLRAQVMHPDRGGDPSEFMLLKEAYETLHNDDRRKRYDAGEYSGRALNIREEALKKLSGLAYEAVQLASKEDINPVLAVRMRINKEISSCADKVLELRNDIEAFELMKGKLVHAGDDPDLFTGCLDDLISNQEKFIIGMDLQVEVNRAVLELLDSYRWRELVITNDSEPSGQHRLGYPYDEGLYPGENLYP